MTDLQRFYSNESHGSILGRELFDHTLYIWFVMQTSLAFVDKGPSQHQISGHYLSASETPFGWCFARGPIVARLYMLTGDAQILNK